MNEDKANPKAKKNLEEGIRILEKIIPYTIYPNPLCHKASSTIL